MSMLGEAIDDLYDAFSTVPHPVNVEACPHCRSADKAKELISGKSPRSAEVQAVAKYTMSALSTVGSPEDFLYLLPRILELTATDSAWWPDPELIGTKMRDAGSADWATEHRTAIDRFFSAVIADSLEQGDLDDDQIDSWMCAIGTSGFEVDSRLRAIQGNRNAVLSYFDANATTLSEHILTNPYWERPCESHDAIVAWFHTDLVRQLVFDEYGYSP